MSKETRNLVDYFELSEEWKEEARSNNEDNFEETTYIEPLENQNPIDHSLLDLNECMCTPNAKWDGVIGVSNCLAIGVNLIDDETVELEYIS